MACPPGAIQYDVDMRSHGMGGRRRVDTRLTFCLTINGTTITGSIEQLPGVVLNGTNTPLASGVDQITLQFDWLPSRINLRGFTFPRGGPGRGFLAEFNADRPGGGPDSTNAEAALPAPPPPFGPDVGDTGTGTGQTT